MGRNDYEEELQYDNGEDFDVDYYEPTNPASAPDARRTKRNNIKNQQPERRRVSLSTTERYKMFKNNGVASSQYLGEADIGDGPADTRSREFEPYSFRDWLALKQRDVSMKLASGLGPNTEDEEWKARQRKLDRAQEYAAKVLQKVSYS